MLIVHLVQFLFTMYIIALLVLFYTAIIRRNTILRIVAISVFLANICYLYVFFNGTPWGNKQGHNQIVHLLHKQFPNRPYTIINEGYNFKSGNYEMVIAFKNTPTNQIGVWLKSDNKLFFAGGMQN